MDQQTRGADGPERGLREFYRLASRNPLGFRAFAAILATILLLAAAPAAAARRLPTDASPPAPYAIDVDAPAGAFVFDAKPSARYAFSGAGFGHGVGMSQWGARGRALAGQDAATILGAYYTGATLVQGYVASLPERVRILHASSIANGARIDVVAGQVTLPDVPQPLAAGSWIAASMPPVGAPSLVAFDRAGNPVGATLIQPTTTISGSSDSRLRVNFKPAPKVPGQPGATYTVYRGDLIVAQVPGGFDVINSLPLDQYLYGTVPAEMPATWPTEALRAQAIAARSYALHEQRSDAAFDVEDSTASQVYLGALKETPASTAAVDDTRGEILTYGGAPITAYYHACDAGHTEDAGNLFPGPTPPYLVGVADVDPFGQPYDRDCTHSHWTTNPLKRSQIEAALGLDVAAQIGSLEWIDLSSRSSTGRILTVVLGGTKGTVAMPAQQFRLLYNHSRSATADQLLSTDFGLAKLP